MIYSVSRWNRHLSRSSGTLATDSYWSTVCLGGIAISLDYLVRLILIQNVLQCVSVKSPSLYHHWFPCFSFRLIYSVSWWNYRLSITTGFLAILSYISTVCPREISVFLFSLVPFLSIQTYLQCVLVESASVYHHWHSCYTFWRIYMVSLLGPF